jgi:ubiquinone/menaquinone biosynthesis C-methylase UbiE
MDYDSTDIAVVYDRGRDHGPQMLEFWMDTVESYVQKQQVETILDLGCGTGRFTEALAAHFDAKVIGVDPSTKMLEQARAKLRDEGVRYEIGSGEAIPLPDDSVDLIFMSMCFHHFADPRVAATECRRVLRDGAAAFLRAGVRDRISWYPYVEFFPETRPILNECLPTTTFVREVFQSAGFKAIESNIIIQQIAPDYAAYADKLAVGADSVLVQLSPATLAAGLEAMRTHATSDAGKPVLEPIDIFVFR